MFEKVKNFKYIKHIIIILVLFLITLFGAVEGIYNLVFESCKEDVHVYTQQVYDNNKDLFIVLSVLKAGLSVIEGSSVGVGFELELGDIIQPVYDAINILWYVTFINTVGSKLYEIFFMLLSFKLANYLLLFSLGSQFVNLVLSKRFAIFSKLSYGSFMMFITIYIVVPISMWGAFTLTGTINDTFIVNNQEEISAQVEDLSEAKDETLKFENKSLLKANDNAKEFQKDLKTLGEESEETLEVIASKAPEMIAATIFTMMILPVLLFYVIFKFMSIVIRVAIEKMGNLEA